MSAVSTRSFPCAIHAHRQTLKCIVMSLLTTVALSALGLMSISPEEGPALCLICGSRGLLGLGLGGQKWKLPLMPPIMCWVLCLGPCYSLGGPSQHVGS